MAGKYDPMSGEMIRSHVTDAPISKDSILYPIADFFNSISIPFTKHVNTLGSCICHYYCILMGNTRL